MVVRLSGRRDGLLLAGLAVALITVFDRSIGWLLEVAHDVEVSYGVRLLPALVVLTAIFIAHLHAKRQESRAEAAAAALATRIAQERLRELERLHLLGRQLAGALSMDAILGALWRHLPTMTEERDAWVAIWNRDRVDVLVDTIGHAPERLEERTRHLLDEWRSSDGVQTARRDGDDCCFLLVVAGDPIGVLGVTERQLPVGANTERVLAAASALIAVTIRNVQLFHELHETAVTDSLTACVNRAHFLEVMTAELRRSRRTGSPISLIMIDLDGFKHVNDQDGHLAGDAALAAIGRRLKELLRHSDVRCRYGGDEFLIMLPDTSLKGALHVAEVLRREIEALAIQPSAREAVVTASVGVAAAIPGEVDPVFCIQRADRGLYAAKRAGRNRVAAHEAESAPADDEPTLAKSA
jgi:diguanylate cyclase (GGDEF)-like protein